MLFSPNATQGGRILIGREVHTREDYNKYIKPYKERTWPHGLLRFSVYDEIPPKSSIKSVDSFPWSSLTPVAGSSSLIAPPPTSHIFPTTPVIYSAPSSAMDVDNGVEGNRGKIASFGSCCSVQSTKEDIERLIADFKEDLDHVLKAGFVHKGGSSSSPPLSVLPLFPPSSPTSNFRPNANAGTPALCSVCARQIPTWNICGRCHLVEVSSLLWPHPCQRLTTRHQCDDCSGKTSSFCFGTMAGHQWSHRTAGFSPPWFTAQEPHGQSSSAGSSISMPWSTSTNGETFRNENNVTPVARPPVSTSHSESPTSNTPVVPPVIHPGVICDSCENTIEGVRHKCLDCPGMLEYLDIINKISS